MEALAGGDVLPRSARTGWVLGTTMSVEKKGSRVVSQSRHAPGIFGKRRHHQSTEKVRSVPGGRA